MSDKWILPILIAIVPTGDTVIKGGLSKGLLTDHKYQELDIGTSLLIWLVLEEPSRSSIRQLPGALPTAQETPLSSVPSLVRDKAPIFQTEEDR